MNTIDSTLGLGMTSGLKSEAKPNPQDSTLFSGLLSARQTYQGSVIPIATPQINPESPLQLERFTVGMQDASRLLTAQTGQLKRGTAELRGSQDMQQLVNPEQIIGAVWELASTSALYSMVGEKGQRISDDVATLTRRRS